MLAIAIMVGILVLSLGPDVLKDSVPDPFKPLPHLVAYVVLAAVTFAIRGSNDGGHPLAYWASVLALGLAMVALGGVIEVGQALVHRDAQFSDVETDAIGVLFGFGVWLFIGGVRQLSERRRLQKRTA